MLIIKKVCVVDMIKTIKNEAQEKYATCSADCPRCRISDG